MRKGDAYRIESTTRAEGVLKLFRDETVIARERGAGRPRGLEPLRFEQRRTRRRDPRHLRHVRLGEVAAALLVPRRELRPRPPGGHAGPPVGDVPVHEPRGRRTSACACRCPTAARWTCTPTARWTSRACATPRASSPRRTTSASRKREGEQGRALAGPRPLQPAGARGVRGQPRPEARADPREPHDALAMDLLRPLDPAWRAAAVALTASAALHGAVLVGLRAPEGGEASLEAPTYEATLLPAVVAEPVPVLPPPRSRARGRARPPPAPGRRWPSCPWPPRKPFFRWPRRVKPARRWRP